MIFMCRQQRHHIPVFTAVPSAAKKMFQPRDTRYPRKTTISIQREAGLSGGS